MLPIDCSHDGVEFVTTAGLVVLGAAAAVGAVENDPVEEFHTGEDGDTAPDRPPAELMLRLLNEDGVTGVFCDVDNDPRLVREVGVVEEVVFVFVAGAAGAGV